MSYTSIPQDLRQLLPHPKTPWHVSPELFTNLQFTPDKQTLYKRCVVTEEHPEWNFVHAYFNNEIPQNRMIARIFCLHNPNQTQTFEGSLPSMEQKASDSYFAPTWREKDPHPLRQKVLQVWEKETSQFSPFFTKTKKADGATRENIYEKVKIVPLWHGSSEGKCDAIAKTGFTRFGKHDFVGQEGDDKSTDIGIFGDGIYFTNSAKYASEVYGQGHLLLSWVSMCEPFPIISHTKVLPPNEPRDIQLLKGQGAYKAHNAHYIHVTLAKDRAGIPIRDKKGKLCYYPITQEESPCYNEVIVFESAQTLPRFWIELAVGLVRNPSLKNLLSFKTTDTRLVEFEELLIEIPSLNRSQKPEDQTPHLSPEEKDKLSKVLKELHSLFFILPDFDPTHTKKMYGYIACLFPFLEGESVTRFLRTNGFLQKLLNHSPTLKEEQRKLSLHLAFWHIKQASLFPLDRKLSLYSQAMSYFSVAIKIAESQRDPLLKKEMHLFASHLLLEALKDLLFHSNYFKEKLERAGRHNRPEDFEKLFAQIGEIKSICCQEEDKKIIRQLYDIVKNVVSQEFSPSLQEQYSPYVKEAYKLQAQSFDIPTEKATEKYEKALNAYREAFKTLTSQDPSCVRTFQKETTQKLKRLFQDILEDTLTILGSPPCAFDIRALGSTAREEMGPFSDLKLMIFLADESQKGYFQTLTQILNLQMMSFGEAAHINLVFTSLSQKENPLGLHINPEASPNKDPSLIRPLTQLENFPKTISLATYPLELKIHEKISRHQFLAFQCLQERVSDYTRAWKDFTEERALPLQNLKSQFVEPLNLLLADLSLYFGLAPANSLDILDLLQEKGVFTPQTTHCFKAALSALYTLRVQRHIQEEEREEKLSSPSPSQKKQLEKSYWLILRPLYVHLKKSLRNPEQFETTFTNLDLIQDAFVETVKASDPTPFISALSHIASFLLGEKASPEEFCRYFEILSKDPKHEPLRWAFFEALQQENAPQSLLDSLAHMPNRAGERLSYTSNYTNLYNALTRITEVHLTGTSFIQVKVVSGILSDRYLKPEIIEAIFDEAGKIIKTQHTDSAHAVASTQGLYFKQMPAQPLMEYAIHNLFYRLGGYLTPTNELIRLEVTAQGQKIVYPVLISQEISGPTLKEAVSTNPTLQNINVSRLTWLLLASILTRPGDGRLSNYILNENNTLFCVDNDISFIEPVVRMVLTKKINFCSALFCLPSFVLDPAVLKQFITLDINAILNAWLTDVIKTEEKYTVLFTKAETEEFYSQDPDNRFTTTILFKEGTLVTLNLQFLQLQKYIQEQLINKKDVYVTDLLTQLISLIDNGQSSIGRDIHEAYTKSTGTLEERLKKAVVRKSDKSLTSAQHLQRTFAKIPTWDEIEKRKSFSPTKAKEELLSSLVKILGGTQLTNSEGKHTLQGDFSRLKDNNMPDEVRQSFVLKALQFLASQQDHAYVILRHCAILDTKSLEPFLKESLEHLDISYCPQIRSSDIIQIQKKCPHLKHLSIEGCDQLEKIEGGLFFAEPLSFEYLEGLFAKKCLNLRSIRLRAPQLKSLSLKKTEALTTLELDTPKCSDIDLTGTACINSNLNISQEGALAVIKANPLMVDYLTLELQSNTVIRDTAAVFGKNNWFKCFGESIEAPPLPSDMHKILQSPCPLYPDKKVRETHMLVLLPRTVGRKLLTLSNLEELVKHPKQNRRTQYDYVSDTVKKVLGDQSLLQSSWVFMTKDVLPDSRSRSYADQCKLVDSWSHKVKIAYRIPSALEAATCIFLEYVRSGQHLYSQEPWTYTRCQEKIEGLQVAVGGFAPAGLSVVHDFCVDSEDVGVGLVRQFC